MAEERGSEIPIIDVKNFGELENGEEYKKLREACEEWGCFRLVNHGIPLSLMCEMKKVVGHLLDLPMETKLRNTNEVQGYAYMAPSPSNPLYEGLGLHDLASPQAIHAFCDQLAASPYQKQIIEMYGEATNKVVMDIARKIAKSVGVAREYDVFQNWLCRLRMNKYNFTNESLIGSSGVQLHTDSGFLTLLQDDEHVGGLQVMHDKSGQFFAIDPFPGSFLVNLGDTAKAWSNGRFCNVKHQVKCKEASIRLSIAFFLMGPPKGIAVEAPSELLDSKHPRLYVPFIYEDYFKLRLSKDMKAGDALQFLHTTTLDA